MGAQAWWDLVPPSLATLYHWLEASTSLVTLRPPPPPRPPIIITCSTHGQGNTEPCPWLTWGPVRGSRVTTAHPSLLPRPRGSRYLDTVCQPSRGRRRSYRPTCRMVCHFTFYILHGVSC